MYPPLAEKLLVASMTVLFAVSTTSVAPNGGPTARRTSTGELGSRRSTTSAPASANSRSVNPASRPAPASTTTSTPRSAIDVTDEGEITEGSSIEAIDLVLASSALGNLQEFDQGTEFLSQTHADLSAILDA